MVFFFACFEEFLAWQGDTFLHWSGLNFGVVFSCHRAIFLPGAHDQPTNTACMAAARGNTLLVIGAMKLLKWKMP